MGLAEQQNLKQWLLEELRSQIGHIDVQIAEVCTAWDEVTKAQQTLELVEALLKRMSALARQAREHGATPELTDEFEAAKELLGEYSEKAVIGDVNIIWDTESDIRRAVEQIMHSRLT